MREKGIIFVSLLFLAVIAIEVLYGLFKKNNVYNLSDTLSNITQGVGQQVTGMFFISLLAGLYALLHNQFALLNWGKFNLIQWVTVILLVDFIYYVGHRLAHRVNILVATHIVHHQADDFNLGSALRQSWTGRLGMFPFYLPLAFLGVPLQQLLIAQIFTLTVQFFAHNGTFRGKLGLLEYIFITPSIHRVHHGTNPEYIDRNCGGMLCIWDRLFGTFAEERADTPVKIGILGRTNHYDPIEANFNYYKRIFYVMKKRQGILNKIKVLFETPEKLSADLKKFNYKEPLEMLTEKTLSYKESLFAIIAIIPAMLGQLYYVYRFNSMTITERTLGALVLITLIYFVGIIIIKKSPLGLVKETTRIQ